MSGATDCSQRYRDKCPTLNNISQVLFHVRDSSDRIHELEAFGMRESDRSLNPWRKELIHECVLHAKAADLKLAMLTYSTKPRGGVVHALKLAERLSAMGVEVTVYSLARSDDHEGLRGYFRKVSVPFKIIPYEWHPDLMTRLHRMIGAYSENLPRDLDLYHAQDCVGGTALARMKSRGVISSPVFRTIHHIDDCAEPSLLDFERRALGSAEHRFVVSRYWKDLLKKQYGYGSIITYNGLDLEDFSKLPHRKSKEPTVLFVGGLEPRKGLEYLVLAMEDVARQMPHARLIAVAKTGFGGRDDWRFFEQLAGRAGIMENVDFRESVSQETLLGFYSDCDILVLPSRTEGWGLSLMEAMACRKPVVASRVGGIPELVRNGKEGILVGSGDVAALSQAILKLLKDSDLRRRMGKAGRERVSKYSWDATAHIVLEEYERVLESDLPSSG
jgi:glycosyltransferase involved in cell wall biosynthesis